MYEIAWVALGAAIGVFFSARVFPFGFRKHTIPHVGPSGKDYDFRNR